MPKKPSYPKTIKVGSAVVKIYRVQHENAASGYLHTIVWTDGTGRKTQQFADPAKAEAEARIKASKLAHGDTEGAGMTKTDRDELVALRALARGGVPLLTAMQEWSKAWELGDQYLPGASRAVASARWAAKRKAAACVRRRAGGALQLAVSNDVRVSV